MTKEELSSDFLHMTIKILKLCTGEDNEKLRQLIWNKYIKNKKKVYEGVEFSSDEDDDFYEKLAA